MRHPAFFLLVMACNHSADQDTTDTGDSGAGEAACDVIGDRPSGWDDATHGKLDAPAYDTVFDKNAVHRVDIRIGSADYAAMYAELTVLIGSDFGASGGLDTGFGGVDTGGGMDIPDELVATMEATCESLSEGDACSVDMGGMATDGTCQAYTDGNLICLPGDLGGGMGGGDLSFLAGDPSYYPIDMQADGETWCGVGMRLKGNATLSATWGAGVAKLPFRLNFDHFEDERPEIDDQRFYGFKELSFGNGQGDATLLRDVLASEILEDRGVPAAHNAFYEVYLDAGAGSSYLGLYTVAEDPSDAMMDRVFGDDGGNLYKPEGDCATLACFDEESFEKKSNEGDADWTDAEAMVAALMADRTDEAAWKTNLEATFDVDGFLHWLAVNSAIENWDAYGVMAHNYYLYGVPSDAGRLTWIPWDHNLSLSDSQVGGSDPLLADVGDEWPAIRLLLDDPTYAATYRGYLADALQGAWSVDTFEARVAELATLVEPSLFGANGEVAGSTFLTSEEDWNAALAALAAHAESRHATVEEALAR